MRDRSPSRRPSQGPEGPLTDTREPGLQDQLGNAAIAARLGLGCALERDQLSLRLSRERDTRDAVIQTRVDADYARVDSILAKAEAEVAQVKEDGGIEAAQAQQPAGEEEEGSWWDACTSVVSDTLGYVSGALDAVYAAIEASVTAIMEGAMALADTILEGTQAFVDSALAAFADVAHSLIDELLLPDDPELAAQLHALTDSGVGWARDGVAAIADELQDGAHDLIGGVAETLLSTISAAKNVAQGVLAVGQAVADGDLDALGLDPAIAQDPAAFVAASAKALADGVLAFGDNLPEHLGHAFADLLGAAGLQIPDRLDDDGIADLVLQSMGHPPGSQRFAEVNSSSIAEEARAALSEMLGDRLVSAAADFLLGAFVPGGALVEAMQAAWRLVQFVRGQLSAISGLLASLLDNAAVLVGGRTSGAASQVEAGLAAMVPTALQSLADLVGIGDLPAIARDALSAVSTAALDAAPSLVSEELAHA